MSNENNAAAIGIGNYFNTLGIAGWGEHEPCILAAAKTGTPVLLIGDRGTSKTEFAYRLCRALQGKTCDFQKYDTADATLDDILGLPDMRKLEAGEVGYIGTGTSIWNKTAVIWTEINRASPMFQGKLLEVVRTGTIHGKKTTVTLQFADCNPPRATGRSAGHDTYFMQDALAARFFCVHVPRGSAAIYKSAMELTAQRDAFDNNDVKAIGKFVAPLATLWLDYVAKSPNADHKKQAMSLVASVMLARGEGTYFDVRAAIRTTRMIEELILLHDVCGRAFDLNAAVVRAVIGNVPELNGILRNDRTNDDLASFEQDVKTAAKNALRNLADPSKQSPAGISNRMLREGTFDALQINELLQVVKATQSPSLALTGLTAVTPITAQHKSPDFRKNHAKALSAVVSALRELDKMPQTVRIANKIIVNIEADMSSDDVGTKLAQEWFAHLSADNK